MKSKPKLAILNAAKKEKKKIGYQQAASAVQKKLEEIKNESKMPSAVNNNFSLFRYRV
ncbi:MAG TPA: hypothetical protein VK645_14075 [Chitinophagaceae bacterium]|nr:hypothetical protein [Chitinophagaceae bacterium]